MRCNTPIALQYPYCAAIPLLRCNSVSRWCGNGPLRRRSDPLGAGPAAHCGPRSSVMHSLSAAAGPHRAVAIGPRGPPYAALAVIGPHCAEICSFCAFASVVPARDICCDAMGCYCVCCDAMGCYCVCCDAMGCHCVRLAPAQKARIPARPATLPAQSALLQRN